MKEAIAAPCSTSSFDCSALTQIRVYMLKKKSINMQNALLEIRVPQSHLSGGAHCRRREKWWADCAAIRGDCFIVNAINGSLSGLHAAPQTATFWVRVCDWQHSTLVSAFPGPLLFSGRRCGNLMTSRIFPVQSHSVCSLV